MNLKFYRRLKSPEFALILRLRQQLLEHPELWDQRTERITAPPFTGTSDIWVRANDDRPYRSGAREWIHFNDPHFAIWYPAAYLLDAVKPLVFDTMAQVQAEHLGSVLITRIPAGGEVKPHKDFGWACEFHNCKVYIPLWSNNQCWNSTGSERLVMNAGDAWAFDNRELHSVRNRGDTDRVTLIISMRVDSTNDKPQ